MSNSVERVVVDVGGTLFHTTKGTLVKKKSYLHDLVAQRKGTRVDESGRFPIFFVDRDPKHFGRILNYLRTDHFLVDTTLDNFALNEMRLESMFYELRELQAGIEQLMERKARSGTALASSKKAIVRVHFKDQAANVLTIDPFPIPGPVVYDVSEFTRAFAQGMEATVNELLKMGFQLDHAYWCNEDRSKSFCILSISA